MTTLRKMLWAFALLLMPITAQAAPNIYLNGYIHDSTTQLAGAEPNGGGNPSPNSLSLQTPLTAKTGAVSAAIAVDYNAISLHTQVASPNNPQQQYGLDSGKVNGSFQDAVTINAPGKTGARGFLVVEYLVKGSFSVSGAIDPDSQTFADYQYDLRVGNGFGAEHDPYLQGFYRVFADGTVESGSRDILNKKGQFSPAFTFGSPFPINWTLNSWVRSSQRRPDNFTVDITNASIRIVAVLDDQGKPISDFSMTSESGTVYGQPKLWAAGRDLAENEKPDRAAEANAVNETVPEWSYGYRFTPAGTDLTLFTPAEHTNGAANLEALEGWDRGGGNGPHVIVNTGETNVVINNGFGNLKPIFPGQLFLHPSSDGGFAVVRWTVPATGRYNILARWLDLDNHGGNGFSAHVIIKGAMVFNQEIANNDGIDIPLQNVNLNAGDIVDFVVGARGDYSFDGTGFNAAISVAPAVELSVPGAQNGAVTVTEGQTLTAGAQILLGQPAASVELRDNGKVVGRDDTAPYEFTIENIQSGTHSLRAVAVDARGVEGASEEIQIRAVQNAGQAGATATSATEANNTASATAGMSYFFTELSGDWDNPFAWTPVGVPGPNDDAFITGPGDGRGSVVTLKGKVDVRTLNVGSGSKIVVDSGAPRFERGITGLQGIWLNDCELRGFELVVGSGAQLSSEASPRFFNMVIFNNGDITYHNSGKTVADAASELRNNGSLTLQRTPASNVPVEVSFPAIQHNGGLISIHPGSRLVTGSAVLAAPVQMVAAGAGNIVAAGAGNIVAAGAGNLIGSDGASLLGSDGATLLGPNGALLLGSDGATLVGNAGNTIAPFAAEGETQATAGGIVLKPGAVITGRGNIVGDVINEAGYVAPGSSKTDVIRILGNYTQQAQGTLVLEVGGTSANPPQYDQLQVFGTVNLDGNLVVNTIGGFTPAPGDSFSPLSYTSASGNFASITSNAQINLGPNGMTLQVAGANPPPPKALNIATRMRVESGDNALIAGFIVTGPSGSTKKVMIRGIGPSLAAFGVPGTLTDPLLELHKSDGNIVNDNWGSGDTSQIPAGFAPSDNRESVIVATLGPGNYTAVLKGAHGETGVALAEVYDLEPASSAQLANISTRGFVQTGDDVMIGGFILAGNRPAKVLVRATGPTLAQFGVQGALANPTLELHDSNGGAIGNDDWRETQEAEIQATTIPPAHNREPAVLANLVPGNYTAVVRGKDNTTGIAVVEAFNLQ